MKGTSLAASVLLDVDVLYAQLLDAQAEIQTLTIENQLLKELLQE